MMISLCRLRPSSHSSDGAASSLSAKSIAWQLPSFLAEEETLTKSLFIRGRGEQSVCLYLPYVMNTQSPWAMQSSPFPLSSTNTEQQKGLVARDLCPRCNKKKTRPHRNEMINVHKTLLYHSFPLAFYITNLINYTQTVITVIEEDVVVACLLSSCLVSFPFGHYYNKSLCHIINIQQEVPICECTVHSSFVLHFIWHHTISAADARLHICINT